MADPIAVFVEGLIAALRPDQPRGKRLLVVAGVLLIGAALLVLLIGAVLLVLG